MDEKYYFDILDDDRISILPLLLKFKDNFYLAGGTALALQIGHRDSVDFDFFCEKAFDPNVLYESFQQVFSGHNIQKIQEEENTLGILVDGTIKITFMTFPYPLIKIEETEYLQIASMLDIAAMKLSAITGRATMKDYVDLYFILHKYSLSQLLGALDQKNMSLQHALALKSLVYYDDIEIIEINFKHGKKITFGEVKEFLELETKKYVESL